MTARWGRVLGTDLRSLAFFRVCLGAYLLLDGALRLPLLNDLYSDYGFLPRDAMVSLAPSRWLLSLYLSSGNVIIHTPLVLAAMFLAAGLACGYRTRFCAIGSWILFTSMHVRNPFVDGLAEDVVVGLLFWTMFLPLNARWSLDAALNPANLRRPNPYSSVAVVALLLQVCCVYWFTTALETRVLFPQVSWLSPGLVAALKIVGPALVFFPLATDAVRSGLVLLFVGLHLSAAAGSGDSWAGLICSISWTLFLPESFWSALGGWAARGKSVQEWLDRGVDTLRADLAEGPAWAQRWLTSRAPMRELGPVGRVIVVGSLTLALLGYASNEAGSQDQLPAGVEAVAAMAQLGQPWSVPPTTDPDSGWFVVEGVQVNGRRMDMLQGGAVNWARPAEPGKVYRNARLERYMMRLLEPAMAPYRPYYAGIMCDRWNGQHRGPTIRLSKVYVNYMQEGPDGVPNKRFLLQYTCT